MSAIVILITGAASGIGRALALNAHARGHIVYATDRDTDALAGLAALGLRTQRLDVTSAADIAALVARLDADGVGPDMLINNAGFGAIAPVLEIAPGRLRAQFEVNVFAIVALCQALAPRMMARRQGRIVNIGSISGLVNPCRRGERVVVVADSGAHQADQKRARCGSQALEGGR